MNNIIKYKTTDLEKILTSVGVDKKTAILMSQKNCRKNGDLNINDLASQARQLDKKAFDLVKSINYTKRMLQRVYTRFRKQRYITRKNIRPEVLRSIRYKLNAEIIQFSLKELINKNAVDTIFDENSIDPKNNKNKFKARIFKINKLIDECHE